MAFELQAPPEGLAWPLLVDKAKGVTVIYRGPQPDGVANVQVQLPDGEFDAAVFDDTKLAGSPELDVLWTVKFVRPAPGAKKDDVMAALKDSLTALSFRKQAIKMKDVPVLKSITVDFEKTVWG